MRGLAVAFWNSNGLYLPKNILNHDEMILKMIKILNKEFIKYDNYFWNCKYECTPLKIGDLKKGVNQIIGN